MEEEINTLRAQKAELEDESADLRLKVTELRRRIYEIQQVEKPALTRAESASPAKHPDTERLDWLEAQPSKYEWAITLDHGCVFVTRNKTSGRPSIRAAIDAARNQEAAR